MATKEPGGKRRKLKSRWINLTDDEMMSIVCNLFVGGMDSSEITKYVKSVYEEPAFKRSDPFRFVRRAAERGMFSFARVNGHGRELGLEKRIRDRYAGLNTVQVICSVFASDTAAHAAKVVVDWIRAKADAHQTELRIGLMGGGTVMALCQALARELAELSEEEKESWPLLKFQALAVGDNVRQPLEDPASFFTYFADLLLDPLKREYIGVHAPVFRARGAIDSDPQTLEFNQLRAEARNCDIVLVSAGDLRDEHSFLGALQATAPATWQGLREAGVRGDLGRLPVSLDGPSPLELFEHPPCTLIALEDLQLMVRERRRVMLVAAPCGDCRQPKSGIIETLLELRNKGFNLFSDLICDSRSARNMPALTRGAPPTGRG